MKKETTAWGNLYTKKVKNLSSIPTNSSTLVTGNNNSYGDAAIPFSNNVFNFIHEIPSDYISPVISIKNHLFQSSKFLYGIPGKSNVTLGGAVAADTHGKDGIWGGSFQNNINELLLLTPGGELEVCNRTTNSELFKATIGGYGLTGKIVGMKFNESDNKIFNYYETAYFKGSGLSSLLNNFSSKKGYYTVAWVDLISKNFKWVLEESKPVYSEDFTFIQDRVDNKQFKFSVPFIGTNRWNTMSIINATYYMLTRKTQTIKKAEKVFFPLSKFSDTRNVSKERKIVQIQFSIPFKHTDKTEELLKKLIDGQNPILCSVKRLSENNLKNNLSFVQDGWTFAVDFPYYSFSNEKIRGFYRKLIDLNGKVYLAKDSTLLENEFKEMYSNYSEWRDVLKFYDPKKIFQSELSKRLNLKGW